MIEILSPSNRRGASQKVLQDYPDLGVREIVFLDPAKRTATFNGEIVDAGSIAVAGAGFELEPVWRLFEST